MSDLFIVIPVFNGWPQTRKCLEALLSSNAEAFHIIVVNHGSTDETKEGLINDFPSVTVVEANNDLWWTGATNLGIRQAMKNGAGHIMLLNNDCYVSDGTITKMLAHSTNNPGAVIAPLQINTHEDSSRPYHYGTCFLLGFSTFPRKHPDLKLYRDSSLKPVRLIMGCRGVVIPTDIFNKTGLFDDQNLPHYGADHDFYLRCVKLGIPLFVATDSLVQVDTGKTSLAYNSGSLALTRFLDTLWNRKSHRNLKDLTALFAKYYPVPGLHLLGVTLNIARYAVLYFFSRLQSLAKLKTIER